jgi:hypothetical protein
VAFARDTSSIRHHGNDHICAIAPAVVRYSLVTSLRLALPLAISSYRSPVRGVEESAGTKATQCALNLRKLWSLTNAFVPNSGITARLVVYVFCEFSYGLFFAETIIHVCFDPILQ